MFCPILASGEHWERAIYRVGSCFVPVWFLETIWNDKLIGLVLVLFPFGFWRKFGTRYLSGLLLFCSGLAPGEKLGRGAYRVGSCFVPVWLLEKILNDEPIGVVLVFSGLATGENLERETNRVGFCFVPVWLPEKI